MVNEEHTLLQVRMAKIASTNVLSQFGWHGAIKRMMKILSKRRVEDHVDLELVCQDGKKLAAHKFIFSAQSQFLK